MEGMPIRMLNGTGLGCGDNADCGCSQQLGAAPPVIKWDTEPNTSSDGREVDWECNDWVAWHKRLKERWGLDRANEVFAQWWHRIEDETPWYAKLTHYQQYCGYGSDFLNYFKQPGHYNDHISFVAAIVTPITTGAGYLTSTAVDTVNDAADSASNTAKVLKILIPALLITVVAGGGYYVYKNYIKGNKKIKAGAVTLGKSPIKKRRKTKK